LSTTWAGRVRCGPGHPCRAGTRGTSRSPGPSCHTLLLDGAGSGFQASRAGEPSIVPVVHGSPVAVRMPLSFSQEARSLKVSAFSVSIAMSRSCTSRVSAERLPRSRPRCLAWARAQAVRSPMISRSHWAMLAMTPATIRPLGVPRSTPRSRGTMLQPSFKDRCSRPAKWSSRPRLSRSNLRRPTGRPSSPARATGPSRVCPRCIRSGRRQGARRCPPGGICWDLAQPSMAAPWASRPVEVAENFDVVDAPPVESSSGEEDNVFRGKMFEEATDRARAAGGDRCEARNMAGLHGQSAMVKRSSRGLGQHKRALHS